MKWLSRLLPPLFVLVVWLAHSRALWLSVLERVKDESTWKRVVKFIRRYGGDLFTQHFLNIGNLRAILHQGVDAWARHVEQTPYAETPALIEALDRDARSSRLGWIGLGDGIGQHHGAVLEHEQVPVDEERLRGIRLQGVGHRDPGAHPRAIGRIVAGSER